MGYIKHNAVIVTYWNKQDIEEAHLKAIEVYKDNIDCVSSEKCISPIMEGVANQQFSFFIAPDGSKSGWQTEEQAKNARKIFQNFLLDSGTCEYIEICFGGDCDTEFIVRSAESDLNKTQKRKRSIK
ncbi:conserved protein of unknown function [Tenacibaculum sp. 190524A02b]|uniref:hypothetical protein n=1 Tax=Tenacibaculum vairaonense TaxID=3137860 RepID=UPI0032B0FCB4